MEIRKVSELCYDDVMAIRAESGRDLQQYYVLNDELERTHMKINVEQIKNDDHSKIK